ncbi:UAA transporter family-domain-containing protein [Aspergillus karnatakaensis]|uniref:putative UPD-GlcNAc transporter (Mnn2-2) n=1 Tax=Aspergillus karnatakaensis TaxID=1810916 RepID=UPI003CCD25D9
MSTSACQLSMSSTRHVISGHNDDHITSNSCQLKSRANDPELYSSPSAESPTPTAAMDKQKTSADLPVSSMSNIAATAAQTTLAHSTSILLMVSLIFGGCCANVFALEAIIKDQPSSGPLITFAQFLLTALLVAPSFVSLSAGFRSLYIRPRSIPLRSWFVYTAFFISVNLLNNWAFAYRISVPLHIILRSGGPVASMVVGHFHAGKRYSRGQISAVALLTFGVVTSALADAQAKGQSIQIGVSNNSSMSNTLIGFAILALAMLLSAFQGTYADRLYETYGRSHWKEALFYSHTLSLPLFLPTSPQLLTQWHELRSSPSLLSHISNIIGRPREMESAFNSSDMTLRGDTCATSTSSSFKAIIEQLVICQDYETFQGLLTGVPVQVFYLMLNALTQYWCIRGVHLLSAKSSSLTVTIVLNIRKLVSLLLSIHLFGNTLSHGVLVGAILVFVGGAIYGCEGARLRNAAPKRD